METRRSYRPPPAATVSPSANLPAAAVVRKGRAREQQDLFAGVDDTHALRAVVIDGQQGGEESTRTGERNENSVLFSASVFKSPEPPPPARARMDSSTGTIDLCALAKANGSSLEYKPLTLSEPPMGAFVHDVPVAAPSVTPKRVGLFIGAGAAAMLVLGIVGVATFAGGADEPTAPAHQAAARGGIVESVRTTVTREEAPAPATAVAAVGRSGKSAAGMGFASSGRGVSSSAASSPAPVTPKKPVVAKAADPCHCKGVLACVIRCSATGH